MRNDPCVYVRQGTACHHYEALLRQGDVPMSDDRFTEVTQQSWFSRITGAVKGILVGLVLFVVSFPLLFWNEGRAVQTAP